MDESLFETERDDDQKAVRFSDDLPLYSLIESRNFFRGAVHGFKYRFYGRLFKRIAIGNIFIDSFEGFLE